jgi:hypothetical protein
MPDYDVSFTAHYKKDNAQITKIYTAITRITIKKGTTTKIPIYLYSNKTNEKINIEVKRNNKRIKILKKTKRYVYTNKKSFIYTKALKLGTTKVTITANGKKEVLYIKVTTKIQKPIKSKVVLNEKKISIGKYSYIKIYSKNNAQYKMPTFRSKNNKIATIDKAGRIMALKKGRVTIITKHYGWTYKNKLTVVK